MCVFHVTALVSVSFCDRCHPFHCNLVSIMKTAACVSSTELLPLVAMKGTEGARKKKTYNYSQPDNPNSTEVFTKKSKKTTQSGRLKKTEQFSSTLLEVFAFRFIRGGLG